MNNSLIALSLVVLATTGCTGTYTKDNEGNVAATGYAAVAAASANTSHKEECVGGCRSPGWSGNNNGSSRPNATPTQGDDSFANSLKNEAQREAERQMRWRIRQNIQRIFNDL